MSCPLGHVAPLEKPAEPRGSRFPLTQETQCDTELFRKLNLSSSPSALILPLPLILT